MEPPLSEAPNARVEGRRSATSEGRLFASPARPQTMIPERTVPTKRLEEGLQTGCLSEVQEASARTTC